jgi:hypothetical protein
VRLIQEGFLNEASVADLADRLGIGPRHLLGNPLDQRKERRAELIDRRSAYW